MVNEFLETKCFSHQFPCYVNNIKKNLPNKITLIEIILVITSAVTRKTTILVVSYVIWLVIWLVSYNVYICYKITQETLMVCNVLLRQAALVY